MRQRVSRTPSFDELVKHLLFALFAAEYFGVPRGVEESSEELLGDLASMLLGDAFVKVRDLVDPFGAGEDLVDRAYVKRLCKHVVVDLSVLLGVEVYNQRLDFLRVEFEADVSEAPL